MLCKCTHPKDCHVWGSVTIYKPSGPVNIHLSPSGVITRNDGSGGLCYCGCTKYEEPSET
jgi:hypothetical protein